MAWIVQNLWLVPVLPMLAAGIGALLGRRCRIAAASLAIGSIAASFLISLCAFIHVLRIGNYGEGEILTFNFPLVSDRRASGSGWDGCSIRLTAVMLLMVTFVGLLIFIYSVGYMEHDDNFTRFFCFLALFAGAMLGVVIANSLLLLFMCWEIVGLTSYLLIGFWYHKPEAAAAAKKSIHRYQNRPTWDLIGHGLALRKNRDASLYDGGAGSLEPSALAHLVAHTTVLGMAASTAIALLIFLRRGRQVRTGPPARLATRRNGGPHPVSALIHAATMVAAGVFLIARIYPLIERPRRQCARPNRRPAGSRLGRRNHRRLRCVDCGRAVRHQSASSLTPPSRS